MRKKMMSVLLALAMVLTLLPATALAEGQTIYVNAAAEDDIAEGTAEDPYMTLQSAIAAASEGATIVLQSDLTVNSTASQNSAEIMISKALTLEGNGHKIIAGSFANGAHVVGVHSAAGAVTIQNLTIVGSTGAKHCLNVYQCTDTVSLNNVTLKDSATAGLVINGSTVVANGLTTSGNAWGAVNVDNSSSFTLTGASSLAENAQIWTEDSSTVNAAGYTAVTGGLAGDGILKGFTYYTTDPAKLGAAQIGNHVYISLAQAISDVTDTAEIKLLNSVQENVTIPAGKTITLDLNGRTLDGGTTQGTAALTNYGTVTILDSGVGGTIKRSDNGTSGTYYTIYNEGTMTIKGGNVCNNSGSATTWSGSSLICNGAKEAAVLNIEGGTFGQDHFIAIKNDEKGTLNITGGVINSKAQAVQNWKDATISGGVLTGDVTTWTYYSTQATTTIQDGASIAGNIQAVKLTYSNTPATYKPNVVINGGSVTGNFVVGTQTFNVDGSFKTDLTAANISITGGTFSADPTQFLADGYKTYQANGTYKVVSKDSIIITFDSKGGSSVAPVATNAAGKLTTLPVPTLSGYVFSGWYTEAGVQVTADTVFTADTTVTAQWTYVPPYTPPTGGNTGNTGNTSTVTNPDGSTTTTVTKPDGTVTVTDKDTQGNVTETVSKPDGTSTTTVTTTNGSSSVTTMGQTGKVEAQVNLSQSAVNAADNEAVALPMASLPVTDSQAMAPVVTVDLPTGTAAAKVEVPVQNVTAGIVAILVKADGSQEIVKTSVTTESGVVLTVEDGAKVMIVDNSKDFADVPASYWGSDAVDFATSRDLFNGTSATTFDPDADMNRAMIVTVLARLEGVDTTTGSTWYEAGQQWAIEAGISDGSDLNSAVSREQLVTMLYRYAGSPAVSGVIGGYADTDSVSSWAVEAMTWAINEGIINGVGNSLDPQGDATRAQVATILMRFVAAL